MSEKDEIYDSMVAAYERVAAADAEPNMIIADIQAGIKRLMWLGYTEDQARDFINSVRSA